MSFFYLINGYGFTKITSIEVRNLMLIRTGGEYQPVVSKNYIKCFVK